MIRIGTSGYNHRDWIGSFYPAELGPARYLERYAEELDMCELTGAVHRVPEAEEARRILGESEGRLVFTVLAPRRLTSALVQASAHGGSHGHARGGTGVPPQAKDAWRRNRGLDGAGRRFPELGAGFLVGEGGSEEVPGRDYGLPGPSSRDARATQEAALAGAEMDRLLARLREGLLPYARAGRFGGVVLPLPRSVPACEGAFETLARIGERLEDLPLLVEPRDPSWVGEMALGWLREIGAGLVLADGPDPAGPVLGPDRGRPRPLPARPLAPFAPVTGEIACVRFHGRDGETRWAGGAARRDYLYSWEELVSWLPTLRALAARSRELHIVFNNPWRGRAVENARMMRRLIGHERALPHREEAARIPTVFGIGSGGSRRTRRAETVTGAGDAMEGAP